MQHREEDMSEEDKERLTREIIDGSGIPYSIDAEGCLHFDLEAIEQQLAALDEEGNDEDDEHEEGGESF